LHQKSLHFFDTGGKKTGIRIGAADIIRHAPVKSRYFEDIPPVRKYYRGQGLARNLLAFIKKDRRSGFIAGYDCKRLVNKKNRNI